MKMRLKALSRTQVNLLLWVYATNSKDLTIDVPAHTEHLRVRHAMWMSWSRIEHVGRLIEVPNPRIPFTAVLTRDGEEMVAAELAKQYEPRNGRD